MIVEPRTPQRRIKNKIDLILIMNKGELYMKLRRSEFRIQNSEFLSM